MILYFLTFGVLPVPDSELSQDGYELNIYGYGEVTQTKAREKGDFRQIKNIYIFNSTSLSNHCFNEFESAQSIILPTTLTNIGESCFQNCFNLKYIIIPEGVTELKMNTFFGCYSLQNITIPKSLRTISTEAVFYYTQSLKKFYVAYDSLYFSSDSTNSYLMSQNKTVLYKGPSSSHIVIPDSVKIIETSFSYECNLYSISFEGSNVEEIRGYAFASESVDKIELPNTLKKVDNNFFGKSIGTLFVPNSVKFFPSGALQSVQTLGNLIIEDNPDVFYKNQNGIIFKKNEETIFFIPSTADKIEISSKLKFISQNQIKSHNIKSIVVQGTGGSFSAADDLLYVNESVLYACPGGLKTARVSDRCTTIMKDAFSETLVESVIIDDSVTEIQFNAFGDCKMLSRVNIPSRLVSIHDWCFKGCSSLNLSTKFPSTFSFLSEYAFRDSNIIDLDFSECSLLDCIYTQSFASSSLRSIKLPSSVNQIFQQSFYNCSNLSSLDLPANLSKCGSSVFQMCTNLQNINFTGNNLVSISDKMFEGSAIVNLRIPSNVQEIQTGAFKDCTKLVSISFDPNSNLKKIKFGIVAGCINLINFEIPQNVNEIEEGAFCGPNNLMNFSFKSSNQKYYEKDGVLFMNSNILFSFPGGRTSATISKDVVSIAGMAFGDCVNLEEVNFSDGCIISSIGSYTFSGCLKLLSIVLPGGVEEIEDNAFRGCTNLSHVIFGSDSKLTILSASVFAGCTNLKTVSFDGTSSLAEIGSEAMKECKLLERFDIPNGVKTVGESAFEGCGLLSIISLPNVEKIKPKAFARCASISTVVLPQSLTELGNRAFAECFSLTKIVFCNPSVTAIGIDCFVSVGTKEVFVPQGFEEKSVGNLNAVKVLDTDCSFPTDAFTLKAYFCSEFASESMLIASAALSSEGG